MWILYWLNDIEAIARLIEQVRPFVDEHGSAEQRRGFLLNMMSFFLRRDRYQVAEETVEVARAAYAAAEEEADPLTLAWTGFNYGFTLLWHGDLDEATALLRHSLREGERCGDAMLRSRAATYLMVVMRKRGDVDGVRQAIGAVIEQAREASLPEYEAMALANRAWVSWRCREADRAAADALDALEMWEKLPVRYFVDWMALWPMLAMALAASDVDQAVQYARRLLPPPSNHPSSPPA